MGRKIYLDSAFSVVGGLHRAFFTSNGSRGKVSFWKLGIGRDEREGMDGWTDGWENYMIDVFVLEI